MINKGLGRGLSSLIPQVNKSVNDDTDKSTDQQYPLPQTVVEEVAIDDLIHLSPDRIVKNPWQPRTDFKHEELEQLAESIKKYGILEPLIVVKRENNYQLIAGERRLQAATMVGLAKVPVIVKEADDLRMLELSLIENLQREDLNPIEEAEAYKRLMDEFQLTQEEVAAKVDKNRSTVANDLRLLKLPSEIRQAIRVGVINRSQAKNILSVADPKYQMKIFKRIIKEGLTVRQSSRAVSQHKSGQGIRVNIETSADEEKLRNYLATKVKIEDEGGQGKIIINYYSLEELKKLINKIVN